jgi:hypothetical protein
MPKPWAPPEVSAVYRGILASLASTPGLAGDQRLSSQWPIVGASPDRILVIGQATYGWIPDWTVSQLHSSDGVGGVLRETQAPCYDRDDPMSWVAEYRGRSSPFWTCVRLVSEATFSTGAEPWYSHVAWTNLYPVGPREVRGNPEGQLLEAQAPLAAQWVDAVAQACAPAFVLLLAGSYWWRHAEDLPLALQVSVDRPLFAAGSRHGRPWVVGMHPKGASLRGWSPTTYAAQVVDAFRRMTDGT